MSRRLIKLATAFFLIAYPAIVSADQCAWISADQASSAQKLLQTGSIVVDHCEPCGDKVFNPSKSEKVASIVPRKIRNKYAGGEYWEVFVNDKSRDLAYLYLAQSDGTFANVSKLIGCPSQQVSEAFSSKGAPLSLASGFKKNQGSTDSPAQLESKLIEQRSLADFLSSAKGPLPRGLEFGMGLSQVTRQLKVDDFSKL